MPALPSKAGDSKSGWVVHLFSHTVFIRLLTSAYSLRRFGEKFDLRTVWFLACGAVEGAGTIDSRNNLDFKMAVTLSNAAATAGSPVASAMDLVGKLTGGGCKGLTVPFLVHGTTTDPKFVPDVGGMVAAMLNSRSGCSGSTTSGKATKQSPVNPPQSIESLFGKKKTPQQGPLIPGNQKVPKTPS